MVTKILTPEQKIAKATTFEELYIAIKEIGPVRGTCLLHEPKDLKHYIEDFRKISATSDNAVEKGIALSEITHAYGIQDKVAALSNKEHGGSTTGSWPD